VIPKDWVTERFTQAQLNADPQLQVTVLRGWRAFQRAGR
jgi:hypothetical protein